MIHDIEGVLIMNYYAGTCPQLCCAKLNKYYLVVRNAGSHVLETLENQLQFFLINE